MKLFILALLCGVSLVACNNSGKADKPADTTSINVKTNSPADGGPNNGLGDTNTYNRGGDTTTHDTLGKR